MDNADDVKWYTWLMLLAYVPLHKVKLGIAKRKCKREGHKWETLSFTKHCERCGQFYITEAESDD